MDPREGHDDLLVSVALAVEAAQRSRPRIAMGRAAKGKRIEGLWPYVEGFSAVN